MGTASTPQRLKASMPSQGQKKPKQLAKSKKNKTKEKVISSGRWTKEEHELFLQGVEKFPYRAWKQIATLIETRTVVQIRTHAQKYFQKLEKEKAAEKKAQKASEDKSAGEVSRAAERPLAACKPKGRELGSVSCRPTSTKASGPHGAYSRGQSDTVPLPDLKKVPKSSSVEHACKSPEAKGSTAAQASALDMKPHALCVDLPDEKIFNTFCGSSPTSVDGLVFPRSSGSLPSSLFGDDDDFDWISDNTAREFYSTDDFFSLSKPIESVGDLMSDLFSCPDPVSQNEPQIDAPMPVGLSAHTANSSGTKQAKDTGALTVQPKHTESTPAELGKSQPFVEPQIDMEDFVSGLLAT